MMIGFEPLPCLGRFHAGITDALAGRLIEAERLAFPRASELCCRLAASRAVLRESTEVMADKGLVEMKPRVGTRGRLRNGWWRLDPDVLVWQAQANTAATFPRDRCEVRLSIEPSAAGFAAVQATPHERTRIVDHLQARKPRSAAANQVKIIGLDFGFHMAVVAASHNPLLKELSSIICQAFRIALSVTSRLTSTAELGMEAHRTLLKADPGRDPMAARRAAEEVVGLAMLAVERAIRSEDRNTP